jgi:hypothetical protein
MQYCNVIVVSSDELACICQITMKSGNEKPKSTHCWIHSKIQTKHRRKKGANSIPFNTQIHASSSEDTTITFIGKFISINYIFVLLWFIVSSLVRCGLISGLIKQKPRWVSLVESRLCLRMWMGLCGPLLW